MQVLWCANTFVRLLYSNIRSSEGLRLDTRVLKTPKIQKQMIIWAFSYTISIAWDVRNKRYPHKYTSLF